MKFLERANRLLQNVREKSLVSSIEGKNPVWKGSESRRYKEWFSPDGTRHILAIISGGQEYGGVNMKDFHLSAVTNVASAEIMRVQVVTSPNSDEIEYNVYLNAITESEDGSWYLSHISYFQNKNGKVDEPRLRTFLFKPSQYQGISDEEYKRLCIDSLRSEGVYHISEVLPEIDTQATVSAFIAQIESRDFSKPLLIPKPKNISDGIENI